MDTIDQLAEYGKLLHDKGFVIGSGGNISARDGRDVVIKKRGCDMSVCGKKGYARVPFAEASQPSDSLSTETPFHLACYAVKNDIGSVFHVHSPAMIAVANKTRLLENISYEFDCIIGASVPVIDYIKPGSSGLAAAIAEEIKDGANCVLLRRHGGLSVGKDPQEAYLRILALERACITYFFNNS